MRLLLSLGVAVVISLGCLQSSVVAGGTPPQSANGPGFRTIVSTRGVPLSSQLLPGDRLVIVKRGILEAPEDAERPGTPPTVEEELDQLAVPGHAILLVEVLGGEGILVEQGAWINTRVKVLGDRVIKDLTPRVLDNLNTVTFDLDGGELILGGVTLRATARNYSFRRGQKYLIALQRLLDGTIGLGSMPFLIDDKGDLARMNVSDGSVVSVDSSLYGLSLDWVAQKLARVR